MRLADIGVPAIALLIERYGLKLYEVAPVEDIPGSFWGDSEAGLIGGGLYVRGDTPLHSILHETCHYICMSPDRRDKLDTNAGGACHYICMSPDRRDKLDTNAGGDYDEENAVCFLQILLADQIPGFGQERAMLDMDSWGYSFRLGSARAWFENDARDANDSLLEWGLIDAEKRPTWRLRMSL
jgi:hypothetical protein